MHWNDLRLLLNPSQSERRSEKGSSSQREVFGYPGRLSLKTPFFSTFVTETLAI